MGLEASYDVGAGTVADLKDFEKLAEVTKSQPIAMAQKRELMEAQKAERNIIRSEVSYFDMLKYRVGFALGAAWHTVTEGLFSSTSLWTNQIKNVEGGHGSHVGIYFQFMRWNMMLNILLSVLWGFGVTLPQFLQTTKSARQLVLQEMYPSPSFTGTDPTVTAIDYWGGGSAWDVVTGLVRGSSYLNHSEYFMGNYMQDTFATNSSYRLGRAEVHPYTTDTFYYVPMAYMAMGIVTVVVSLGTLLSGVYKSFTGAVSHEDLIDYKMSAMIFSEYDHAITWPKAMTIHQKDNAEKIKEILGTAAAKHQYEQRMKEYKFWIYTKRFVVNILVLGILGGSCAAIYFATEAFINDPNFFKSIIPTITMVALNAGIPFIFEALAEAEEWETPLFVIIITVIRSTAEKVFVFAVFITAIQNSLSKHACWETAVGTETYAYFVVGVLIAEIFTSIFIDILLTALNKLNKKWNGTHINEHGEIVHPPHLFPLPAYFDTVKKILELSFAQALIWFGVFFSPLLPLVGVIRCFILFYVQVWSTNTFCSPKGTPFQAKVSFSGVIWITLGVHLVVGFVPCWYLVMSETPSGIFRTENARFLGTLYSPHEYDVDAKLFQQVRDWDAVPLGTFAGTRPGTNADGTETVFHDQVPSYPTTSIGANVSGWCIVKPDDTGMGQHLKETATAGGFSLLDKNMHVAECAAMTWNNTYSYYDAEYTGPEDRAIAGLGTITQCAELPNMITDGCISIADTTETAGCEKCMDATEEELNKFICYESKVNSTAWLPHDCGVGLRLQTLCQRCPSGCGPFRNREEFFDIFSENQAMWDLTSDSTKAKINRFFVGFFEFLASPPFTVILFITLIIIWAVKSANLAQSRKVIEKLIRERAMDRIDKEWMLAEYGVKFEHKTDLNDGTSGVGKSAMAHRKAAHDKAKFGDN